jgi:homoserine dehydrogenase
MDKSMFQKRQLSQKRIVPSKNGDFTKSILPEMIKGYFMERIGIGLAGFGTVGAGVYENLERHRDLIAERSGYGFDVRRIAVRDLKKARDIIAPAELFTNRWQDLLEDPEIRIIVELIGGTTEAFELTAAAIRSGRIVITGNKALLAEKGQEIFALACEHKVPVFFEAAVAGGIPIIQSLRDAFVGNRIESIHGILNGTSNYILTRMQDAGLDYPEALAEAIQLGYAEADPALDINGWDAGHKAIILAALAYGFWVDPATIRIEGIDRVSAADIQFAKNLGYSIKLLGSIRARKNVVEVGVVPTLIPKEHVLASVNGVFNAIAVRGDLVGDSLFYGRGAGRGPTATSVVGDLVEAAHLLTSPRCTFGFSSHSLYGTSCLAVEIIGSYYLRLSVDDKPGVLARIAGVLGTAEIGISSVVQPESVAGVETPLVLMIHEAAYGRMLEAVAAITALDCVKGDPVLLNVELFN